GHFKLHLIPSGIFHPGTRNLLGNGVVINPPALVTELDGLRSAGFDAANLFISDRAHLVMPYHVLLDQLDERERGAAKIGTTSRGIGPAYVDKVARRGIRIVDLMEPDVFHARLEATLPRIRRLAAGYADDEMADAIAEATDARRIEFDGLHRLSTILLGIATLGVSDGAGRQIPLLRGRDERDAAAAAADTAGSFTLLAATLSGL
ncbi:MAG: adenylosuccinate synthetase, partial [Vicinamibacteria bacterium]